MSTAATVMTFGAEGFWAEVQSLFLATRTELCLFVAAIAVYLLIFSNHHPKVKKALKKVKARSSSGIEEDDKDVRTLADNLTQQELETAFQAAYDGGDNRHVIRCWNAMKKFDTVPSASLLHAIESMQRVKKDSTQVVRELKAYFTKYPTECTVGAINEVLEFFARRQDSDAAEKVMELLPSISISPDEKTFEIILGLNFTTRNFREVQRLETEMKKMKVGLTTRATVTIIKTALKTGDFAGAMSYFNTLKSAWQGSDKGGTLSGAPKQIVSQLVEMACKDHQLGEFIPLLADVPLTDEVVGVMLLEAGRQKDLELARKVEAMATAQNIKFSENTNCLLLKAMAADSARVNAIFEEALASGRELSVDFTLGVLACCSQSGTVGLANQLYSAMKTTNVQVLSAFVKFFSENDQPEQACAIYERHFAQLASNEKGLSLDGRVERAFMSAAVRCGRNDLAQKFLDACPTDIAKHVAMIRNCGAAGNLSGAKTLFQSLQSSGVEPNSIVYNTVLDACVECRNLKEAEEWMILTKQKGFADVVTYNTMIKAYLQHHNHEKAKSLVEEMRAAGLQPNRVTFNELVNGLVSQGVGKKRSEIWAVIREMKEAGAGPNQVTCSIMLKNLNSNSSQEDIEQTMELIEAVEEPMDEILLSSVVEACVRIGKPELLSEKLKKLGSDNISVTGSHTYGSLIKAYGHAKDIESVWRCWKEMRSRHIRPTSITLGCMVEAVVSNGDTEGAYELIHQMRDDERCREALNSVIYCSVLKGFTREKRLQRVWQVYEEMLATNVDLSIVTYNTLLDACARCGRMDRVPSIFQDMHAKGIQPNLITYSTALKGHCNAGDVRQAFGILEKVRCETKLKPDEIMYNSLLDGCAQGGLVEEGLELLKQMNSEGVQPSNFTLSLLVKLMSRARKLDRAFSIVEEVSKKYNIEPNVHVHTNLVQACITNRQLTRAMSVFVNMIRVRVQPDSRTYALLIRANLSTGNFEQADQLLRASLGLEGASFLNDNKEKQIAICSNLDHSLVGETLQTLSEKGHLQDMAMPLMSDVRKFAPRVRIEPSILRWIMSAGMAQDAGQTIENLPPKQYAKGTGKGKGSRPSR